jgi:hypothetical protein
MRTCLFCDNPARSREHVLPHWILQRPGINQPIHHQIGKDPTILLPTPHLKVKAVCKTCNEGWMSGLETDNIPLIGSLMQDIALSLDGLQQYKIALWAIKTAMVSEFVSRTRRRLFFLKVDCEQLRVASNLPPLTSISIARHSFTNHIGFWGTDAWTSDRGIQAHINTILVGHLAIQTVVLRVLTEQYGDAPITVSPQAGPKPWNELCIDIWPTVGSANWPPAFSFRDSGEFSISRFIRRYSYGNNVLH